MNKDKKLYYCTLMNTSDNKVKTAWRIIKKDQLKILTM